MYAIKPEAGVRARVAIPAAIRDHPRTPLGFLEMVTADDTSPDSSAAGSRQPTLFLSYASQDRAAAISLRDALLGLGFEVWYDESELGGGEAWDQKIRRQIRDCDYFMPVVSAQTETRLEGYFRREWRLAVERTQDMADDHLFLLPVVIDDTDQTVARVPERFLSVQWIKLPGGRPGAALEALGRRIVSGEALQPPSPRKARSARRAGRAARREARLSTIPARATRAAAAARPRAARLGCALRAGGLPATAPVGPDPRNHLAGRDGCRTRLLEQPPRT